MLLLIYFIDGKIYVERGYVIFSVLVDVDFGFRDGRRRFFLRFERFDVVRDGSFGKGEKNLLRFEDVVFLIVILNNENKWS